jgi:hypothetical protein
MTSTPRSVPDSQVPVFSPEPSPLKPETNGVKAAAPLEETPKKPATKSTTGPPVYYPPDHEMFTKKDAPIPVNVFVSNLLPSITCDISECTAPSPGLLISFHFFHSFSRAPWRGRPKAKPRRAPRQVKAMEKAPELTAEQLSSPFAYLSAVPCLVLSCNSMM